MTTNGQNDHRSDDADKYVQKLADLAAGGADSLPLMALHAVKMAAENVWDTEPNKHGKGIDDAKRVFSLYADRISKKSVHDRTGDSVKSQCSKFRAFIKWGMMTTGTPIAVAETMQRLWNEQHAAEPKSVKPTYNAYLDVARVAITQDTDLDDEQLKALIGKADPKEVTAEAVIKRMYKMGENLVAGTNGVKYQEQALVDAMSKLNECLAAFATERETAEDEAEIARLTAKGYKLTPNEHSTVDVDRGLVTDELAA